MNRGRIDGGRGGRGRRVLVKSVASATSAVAILVVGLSWAPPAGAHPDADDHGSISLSATGDVGSPPAVSGTLVGASALGVYIEYIRTIALTATPIGPTGGGPVSADGCANPTAGKCGTGTVSLRWQIPPLAYNGPYVVNAVADHCQAICVASGPATVTPRQFRLAADPAAPGDVRADAGGDRNVTVSWARNSEPDILYYQVSRKDGGGNFARVGGDIRQPASGRPAFADTTTSGTPGGEFVYRVVAVRKGPSGDDTTSRTSRASGEKSVTVAPPPTTLPPGAPGAEIKPAGTDTNIGGYLAGQAPALPSPTRLFIDLPDTGYEGSLPFGQLPGEDMSEPGEENAYPATLETRQRLAEFNRGRPLIPIAAGAILLLLAAHLRLFNKRVKGDGAAHPARRRGTAAADFIASLDASKHAPMAIDIEAAVANGGHHRDPSGAALTDLPEWGAYRGVTLLPPAPKEGDGDEAWAGERTRHDDEASGSRAGLNGAAVVDDEDEAGEVLAEVYDELDEDEDELVAELEPLESDELDEDEDELVAELEPLESDELDEDEDEFVAELEPLESDELDEDEDELVAELEPLESDEPDEDEDEFVAELELAEDADAFEEQTEPDVALAWQPAGADGFLVEVELEDDDDELVAELTHAELEEGDDDGFVVELEDAEVVAQLVGNSGPVMMPTVEPAPEPAQAATEAEGQEQVVDEAPPVETKGSRDQVSDFDDFEWSEEAQYAEPEVEVFVGPRPGRKKLAGRAL